MNKKNTPMSITININGRNMYIFKQAHRSKHIKKSDGMLNQNKHRKLFGPIFNLN